MFVVSANKGWEASEPFDSNQWVQFEFDCHMRIIEIGIKGHKVRSPG